MHKIQPGTHGDTARLAQEAFHVCLEGQVYNGQELLHRVRTELRRTSGDLPIHTITHVEEQTYKPFETQSIDEAYAWAWLELATGVFKLVQDLPGTSLVHFTRAWRIWRAWTINGGQSLTPAQLLQARRERIRASLWLGEAWARFMSDRAEHSAKAILRAALAELKRIEAHDLLRETIAQQRLLPAASLGVPAYSAAGTVTPYVCLLLS